jgi:hypothetical protein
MTKINHGGAPLNGTRSERRKEHQIHGELHRAHRVNAPQAPVSGPPGRELRRGIGRIMHDERGNAYVEWQKVPADWERQIFTIAEDPTPPVEPQPSFNPYDNAGVSPGDGKKSE